MLQGALLHCRRNAVTLCSRGSSNPETLRGSRLRASFTMAVLEASDLAFARVFAISSVLGDDRCTFWPEGEK